MKAITDVQSPNNRSYKLIKVNPSSPLSPGALTPTGSQSYGAGSSLSPTTAVPTKLPSLKGGVQHHAMKRDVTQPMIRVVTDPAQMPVPSVLSQTSPLRDFSQPVHKYPGVKRVDSRSEGKTSSPLKGQRSEAPMEFVGTSYLTVPNAHRANYAPPPIAPTLPKPFAPLMSKDFAGAAMLSNRTANGRILGSAAQRYISSSHIPNVPVEEPVGPDNPYAALSETWTKCWDAEAGAVYYYNNVSGEATWLQPELL